MNSSGLPITTSPERTLWKTVFSLCLLSWPFSMMGFVVVPFQAYLGVDQNKKFKHEFGPKLGGATITHNLYNIDLVDNFR